MSVLSEWDIINELGKGIFIYPFNYRLKDREDSLRACCLRLTTSEYAYTFPGPLEKGKTKEPNRLRAENKPNSNGRFFKIPADTTAVVWTNEAIFISENFCGSVHSKVKLVSKGLGHIGTRVNPNWGGVLAIAIHNLSKEEIAIDIGETIAYLRFYRLHSKSSFSPGEESSGKTNDAIPDGFHTPRELATWLDHNSKEPWRKGSKDEIMKALNSSEGYTNAKEEYKRKFNRIYRFIHDNLPQWEPNVWFTGIMTVATVFNLLLTATNLLIPYLRQFSETTPNTTSKTQVQPNR